MRFYNFLRVSDSWFFFPYFIVFSSLWLSVFFLSFSVLVVCASLMSSPVARVTRRVDVMNISCPAVTTDIE